ncbi:hypothetical protein [Ruegeria sp. HKCCD8929]|uniref:hypothetical protein n=1 Tax=Ruegeria sp. HKCCD8929 TaxID=2683006 RepID=UPI0014899B6B|nr:hypothetical protein [Ruegeria sp. HKCCD8929]
MKRILLASVATAGLSSGAVAEPSAACTGDSYHDLIVGSFERSGFQTDSLKPTRAPEKASAKSDYDTLVRDSFSRAGLEVPESDAPAKNSKKVIRDRE